MSQSTSYDQVAYDSHAFPATHPNRIGALARLHGIAAASPDEARVLELGCASGGNLIPMAVRYPNARFVGIDLSQQQIAEGQAQIAALGIDNIELRCQSITALDATLGRFDYIIAHGVYSWVPPEVQHHLLRVCQDNLADHGVAFVSYNTFPGWHLGGAVRYMMQYHSASATDPEQKVSVAKSMVKTLARLTPDRGAYAAMLGEYADRLEKAPAYYVFHEHLEDNNRPVYFNQFVDHAHRSGLAYLCDAELVTGLATPLTTEATEFILNASRGNLIDYEQYLDFTINRSFRQSLLVRPENAISRNFTRPAVETLAISAQIRRVESPLAENRYLVGDREVAAPTPFIDAAFRIVQQAGPNGIGLQKILADATSTASQAPQPGDPDRLLTAVLELAGKRALDLLVSPWPTPEHLEDCPTADAYTKLQAARGETLLVNKAHRPINVSTYLRDLIRQMDGRTSVPDVAERVARELKLRGGALQTRQGKKLSDLAQMKQQVLEELPGEIALLASNGLVN